MEPDRRDDLVSMTAVVAGAVVSVVVTVMSLIMTDEESAPHLLEFGFPVPLEAPAPEPISGSDEGAVRPRAAEAGPTGWEWMVIRAYEPIESMSASEPSREVVDRSLARLQRYAIATPDNPFVQELYLKGLRVAQYWAVEGGDERRGRVLAARFESYRTVSVATPETALEAILFDIQRLERRCHAAEPRVDAMTAAGRPFLDDPDVRAALEQGLTIAFERCGVAPRP